MIDRSNDLTRIDFEITHSCQKYCKFCTHRCSTSDYEMSLSDYRYVVERITQPSKIKDLLIIGGEPLMHPQFSTFISEMQVDFPQARIVVQTNGRLIGKFFPLDGVEWVVTHYPGWNDWVCDTLDSYSTVKVARMGGLFWDPFVDPDFDEATAKQAREQCTFSVRILGKRLYSCCIAEPLERDFGLSGVSIPFTEHWQTEINYIETWRACQHCFRAGHIINEGVLYPAKTERHDAK